MNESYVVVEGDGSVDVTVGVQVGGLGREVVVTLSTQVGTTKGELGYKQLLLPIHIQGLFQVGAFAPPPPPLGFFSTSI